MKPPRKEVRKGDRFTMLTVLEDRQTGSRTVPCRCDCGAEKTANIYDLMNGKTGSCGCLQRRLSSQIHRVHGAGYEDYRYRLWRNLKQKCFRASAPDYRYYGGRGITMHAAWVDDFASFAAYLNEQLGERPDAGTLDRIDNDGHYEPGNLRWATRLEQAQNRRTQWAQLTLTEKAALVTDYANGGVTYSDLGKKYGISTQMAGINVRALGG